MKQAVNNNTDLSENYSGENHLSKTDLNDQILQHSQYYKDILKSAPDAITITDLTGNILDLTISGLEMFGYNRISEIYGRNMLEFLAPKDHERAMMNINKMFNDDYQGAEEYTGIKSDGSHFNLEVNGKIVKDDKNNPVSMIYIVRDITKRKEQEQKIIEISTKYRETQEALEFTQEKIREKKEELDLSHEVANIGSWHFDFRTNEYYWSDNNYHFLGIPKESFHLTVETFFKLLSFDDYKLLDSKTKEMLVTGKQFDMELALNLPDGNKKWIHNYVIPIFENGIVVAMKGINVDITEKVRQDEKIKLLNQHLEELVRERTKELNNFFNVSLDLLSIFDNEGNFIKVNKAWSDFLGLPVEQIEKHSFLEFIHPDDVNATVETIEFGNEHVVSSFTNRYRYNDGTYRFLEWKSTPVENVNYAAARDVTNVVKNNEFQKELLDLAPKLTDISLFKPEKDIPEILKLIATHVEAESAVIYLMNAAENKIEVRFRWEVPGLSGTTPKEASYSLEKLESWIQMLSGNKPIIISSINEIPYSILNDKENIITSSNLKSFIAFPLIAENQLTGVFVLSYFNKERKLEEYEINNLNVWCNLISTLIINEKIEKTLIEMRGEAESANKAKSEFLSRMSHELRTPMNSILGFAQLLELTVQSEAQNKAVQHILFSGSLLLDLINEVLDLSRIESGKLQIITENINLEPLINEIISIVQSMANRRGISIDYVLSQKKISVKADKQRLKQIMLNLVNNAVKYNKQDGTIIISAHISDAENNMVRISVTDTGIGISDENQKKLFQPFERLGADTSGIEGTGLGLSVVKKMAELMEGRVGVESILNQGSTFWIDLPEFAGEELNAQPEIPDLISEIGVTQNKGLLLYIEDNISNLNLVQTILEIHRPEIRMINSPLGKNALKMSRMYMPDIILLDLNLPDVDGSEVLEELKNNPATSSIPVIVVSADAMTHRIEKLLNSGARDYITKPFDIKHLLQCIDQCFIERK